MNIRWKFTNTMPQPRCSWNVFSNTELKRLSRSDAPCAVLQKWRNRAYAETTASAPAATGTSTPSNIAATASAQASRSAIVGPARRRCRRLAGFMLSTTAPWNGATTLRTKSPSGSGRPAPRTARTVSGLDADGAVTHAAAAWYANESISGSSRQFAASVYMSSDSTSWCSLVSSKGAPEGCLRAASSPCTYPRLVGWPGSDKSSNLVCANHRSYPAKVRKCSQRPPFVGEPLPSRARPGEHRTLRRSVEFHQVLGEAVDDQLARGLGRVRGVREGRTRRNPNRSPSVSAAGARRARHASTPFSISEPPSGRRAAARRPAPLPWRRPRRRSAARPSGQPRAAGSRPGWTPATPPPRTWRRARPARGRHEQRGARGAHFRASRSGRVAGRRLSCFRFMSSATVSTRRRRIAATVVTCTSSFMASICSCGQDVSGCSTRAARATRAPRRPPSPPAPAGTSAGSACGSAPARGR